MGRIAAVIRYLIPSAAQPPRCTVCGGQRSAQRRLISGPRFYACEACIDVALAAIQADRAGPLPTGVTCAFCRNSDNVAAVAFDSSPYWVCVECAHKAAEVFDVDDTSPKRAT